MRLLINTTICISSRRQSKRKQVFWHLGRAFSHEDGRGPRRRLADLRQAVPTWNRLQTGALQHPALCYSPLYAQPGVRRDPHNHAITCTPHLYVVLFCKGLRSFCMILLLIPLLLMSRLLRHMTHFRLTYKWSSPLSLSLRVHVLTVI